MSKMVSKLFDYTCNCNKGFKIAFGDVIVSLVCRNYLDAYSEMEKENIQNYETLDIHEMPCDLQYFTFKSNNNILAVYNQKTDEYLTKQFVDGIAQNEECDALAYGVTPIQLVEILVRVKVYCESHLPARKIPKPEDLAEGELWLNWPKN